MTLEVLFESEERQLAYDPHFLRRIEATQRYLDQLTFNGYYVGKTWSLVDVVKEVNQALNENRQEYYRIPRRCWCNRFFFLRPAAQMTWRSSRAIIKISVLL